MQWIFTVIKLIDKVMDRMPNYEQRKKEKYFKLKKKLLDESKKPNHLKIDGRIDDLVDELILFVDAFSEEIGTTRIQ